MKTAICNQYSEYSYGQETLSMVRTVLTNTMTNQYHTCIVFFSVFEISVALVYYAKVRLYIKGNGSVIIFGEKGPSLLIILINCSFNLESQVSGIF